VPGLQWIDPKVSVSSSNYSEIYRLLVGKAKSGSYGAQTEWVALPLAPEIRVGHDEISKRISADFMSRQTPEWLISFFDFLAGVGPAARNDYLARPILPLENGAWVPANPEEVYLPPENRSSIDLTRFSIVKQSLLESKSVLAFLKTQAGLHEPDFVDAVIRYLLPKFASGCLPFDETTYAKDLQAIATACREDRHGRMLPALNALPFVACVPAWLRETDAVVWKAPASSTMFARTSNLEIWFAGNDQDKPLFLHASVEKVLGRGACGLQFSQDSLLVGCDPFNRGKVRLSSRWGDHKQGLDGFNQGVSGADIHPRVRIGDAVPLCLFAVAHAASLPQCSC